MGVLEDDILDILSVTAGACKKFQRAEQRADIDLALIIAQAVKSMAEDDDLGCVAWSKTLGDNLRWRCERTGEMSDLEEAMLHYELALHYLTAITITRIEAGRQFFKTRQIAVQDWSRAYETSEIAAHLIPKLKSR